MVTFLFLFLSFFLSFFFPHYFGIKTVSLFVWDKVCLCCSGWLQICNSASASPVLGLQASTTTSSSGHFYGLNSFQLTIVINFNISLVIIWLFLGVKLSFFFLDFLFFIFFYFSFIIHMCIQGLVYFSPLLKLSSQTELCASSNIMLEIR
jgi:hypothetical protein